MLVRGRSKFISMVVTEPTEPGVTKLLSMVFILGRSNVGIALLADEAVRVS